MTPEEYYETLARAMKEKTLDLKVRRLLNELGLSPWAFHMPDGTRKYTPGFPDWCIIGPRRVMWRELKSHRGTLSPEQKAVLARLEGQGADVGVWRPMDWFSGRITRELCALAGAAPLPVKLPRVPKAALNAPSPRFRRRKAA